MNGRNITTMKGSRRICRQQVKKIAAEKGVDEDEFNWEEDAAITHLPERYGPIYI